MAKEASPRIGTLTWVYLIIALFVAIIGGLAIVTQVEVASLTAIRAYVGGEGLWAKAQKDAILSLERYAVSYKEADYAAYQRSIEVTRGDRKARIELQKPNPDVAAVAAGLIQGRNNPADVSDAVTFFRRFQHTAYMSRAIAHWTEADRLIAELDDVAKALHDEVAAGRATRKAVLPYLARLDTLNARITKEEDLFSSTLGEASRWAADVSRRLTYVFSLLAVVLGVMLSWPIIRRIRATEGALSESEQKFRTITASAMDAIAMIDDEGKTVFINEAAEKMFGYAADEVLGKDLHLLLSPPRYLDDYRRTYPHFSETGEGAAIGKILELGALRKDGSEFPVELTVSAININGRWNAVGIIRDVSERKRAEEEILGLNEVLQTKVRERTQQLLEAQEELVRKEKLAVLGQVAGSVAHELRNPLGVMSNAVYYLEAVLSNGDETVREYLGIIRNEIAGSERIVSDLLDSVRTTPPHPERVGVRELIEQTLKKCSVPPSVSVALDIPAELPPLRADGMQISQVLRNLISNGVEAMPGGGGLQIVAKAEEEAKQISIGVRDTGTGIMPEQMGKLFQPLFTTKARGIGLGLVVVKNLTEANGGKVEVQSEPGKGTLFAITLPMADERDTEDA